ncbi:hypothetical protein SAMN05444392_102418 [Seinonella peptonophila]|uniref:Zinc ribbon domain-containing protein n=1 Tax=Seinonella peptonophila TaxID=112248 RepID=A0A1M4VLR5_9BACL|nr:hypothetical protein [Seinonella peptonophila]SHE69773.1 hypothetical protein SAMN05444392_102418 [Seinonella peptonophila]
MNIFHDIKNKFQKGFEQAGHQSQRVMNVGRLNLSIKNKKEELSELIHQVGWAFYESWQPDEEWKMTDSVKQALQNVHEVEKQLEELEAELEQLKSSNIKSRPTAETVQLPIATIDEPQINKMNESIKSRSNIVFLCPFCAKEVGADIFRCPHCATVYHKIN